MKKLTLFALILSAALSVFSAEYYVDASQSDDTGSATNWATAKQTIQAAVDLTTDGDTVWVTNGVYDAGNALTPGYSQTNRVCITNAITLCSVNGPEVTIIKGAADPVSTNGASAIRCVYLTTNAVLSGFTLTNGYTMSESAAVYDQGGGVYLHANAVVTNCVITGNGASGDGAGAYLFQGGTLTHCLISENEAVIGGGGAFCNQGGTLNECMLSNNHARAAGGVFFWKGGMLNHCLLVENEGTVNGGGAFCKGGYISDCTFRGNSANYGGGAQCSSDAVINDSLFSNNHAVDSGSGSGYGGGVHLSDEAKLNRCVLSGNSGRYGGGARFWDSTGALNNCLLIGNTANYAGAGADLFRSGTLNGCALSGNSTINMGGGARVISFGTLSNCIFRDNASPRGNDIYQSGSSNVVLNTCASDGITHGVNGCITNNPLFVDGANSNFHLQATSPCINAGHNDYVSTTNDLDSNVRIVGGVVDMGAYERQDAGTDFDADGFVDFWEMENFGSRYSADPASTCSNGINNVRQAYIAGLDPNDPDSKFLASVLRSPTSSILGWNAISGRVYSVQWSTNLLENFQPLETNIPWTAGGYTDTNHPASGQMFYKIDVQLDE